MRHVHHVNQSGEPNRDKPDSCSSIFRFMGLSRQWQSTGDVSSGSWAELAPPRRNSAFYPTPGPPKRRMSPFAASTGVSSRCCGGPARSLHSAPRTPAASNQISCRRSHPPRTPTRSASRIVAVPTTTCGPQPKCSDRRVDDPGHGADLAGCCPPRIGAPRSSRQLRARMGEASRQWRQILAQLDGGQGRVRRR